MEEEVEYTAEDVQASYDALVGGKPGAYRALVGPDEYIRLLQEHIAELEAQRDRALAVLDTLDLTLTERHDKAQKILQGEA